MDILTKRAGRALIVALQGELDAYWAGEAERRLWAEVDKGNYLLILDLAALTYLSSGGLRALLRTHRRLVDLGGKLALAAPQPYVNDVLSVSGLGQTLPVYDTLQNALDALGAAAPPAAGAWDGATSYEAACGTYRIDECAGGRGVLQLVGDPLDHLWSRATPERLTTLDLAQLGYGLAVGASAESAANGIQRLGEMLLLPGGVFWLPGDGRESPDYQVASPVTPGAASRLLSVHLLNGLWVQGQPQFYGYFSAADTGAGASLEDWARGLLGWAASSGTGGGTSAIGVALRAELEEMWGVGLKRAPLAGRGPANGQEISHRENIADWLHFSMEPEFSNYTLLAAGIAAANAGQPVGGHLWGEVFGEPAGGTQPPFRIHLHGAAFRPVPELGGTSTLDEEVRHVVDQGELAAVTHLLPNTRLRTALFGAWML